MHFLNFLHTGMSPSHHSPLIVSRQKIRLTANTGNLLQYTNILDLLIADMELKALARSALLSS